MIAMLYESATEQGGRVVKKERAVLEVSSMSEMMTVEPVRALLRADRIAMANVCLRGM